RAFAPVTIGLALLLLAVEIVHGFRIVGTPWFGGDLLYHGVLEDLAPGAQQTISLPIRSNQFDQSLADRIVGQTFFNDPTQPAGTTQRDLARRAILQQLTYDPNVGNTALPADGPVLLAWGDHRVLDVRISGQVPRRTGNVLYYIPLGMHVEGHAVFDGELIQSTVVSVDAGMFGKDPFSINMGRGSVTMAYRPLPFDGTLTAKRVVLSVGFGGDNVPGGGEAKPVEPVRPQPCRGEADDVKGCVPPAKTPPCAPDDGSCLAQIPAVEVFDLTGGGSWMRLPMLNPGNTYELKNPARYVDPGSGTVLIRLVSDSDAGMSFAFQVRIEGDVR
ncbi:MAG: hypothetical protein ACJ77B_11650, partial [Chloroflexota bacterium]